jgi:microcystin-dependent protein
MLTVYDDPVDSMGISTKNYTDTNVTQAEQRQNTNLVSNVAAINNSLGILTTEINRVNNYAVNSVTQLNSDLTLKAAIASPTFTGVPAAPTAAAGTDTTQLATTAFVKTAVDTAIATTPPGIPTGGIILWSGSVGAIPSGWALCNGTNGTPDLRSRFVVGAGSAYNVNATGGSANSVVVSHTHSVTDPGHSHTNTAFTSVYATGSPTFMLYSLNTFVASTRAYPTSANTTGITVNSSGQSGIDANLPPYYALAYIMKTA